MLIQKNWIESSVKMSKDETIKNIGHYVLDKIIGEGTFGKVRLGIHLITHEKVNYI